MFLPADSFVEANFQSSKLPLYFKTEIYMHMYKEAKDRLFCKSAFIFQYVEWNGVLFGYGFEF